MDKSPRLRRTSVNSDAGGKATLKCVPEMERGSVLYLNCSGSSSS